MTLFAYYWKCVNRKWETRTALVNEDDVINDVMELCKELILVADWIVTTDAENENDPFYEAYIWGTLKPKKLGNGNLHYHFQTSSNFPLKRSIRNSEYDKVRVSNIVRILKKLEKQITIHDVDEKIVRGAYIYEVGFVTERGMIDGDTILIEVQHPDSEDTLRRE